MGGEWESMSPGQRRAFLLRVQAMQHRMTAAQLELGATMAEAGESIRKWGAAMQAMYDAEVAEHPDLAELNVQMDGWYTPDA